MQQKLLLVRELCAIVNNFNAKNSARYNRMFVVTELVVSGTQCIRPVLLVAKLNKIGRSREFIGLFVKGPFTRTVSVKFTLVDCMRSRPILSADGPSPLAQ